VFGCAWTLILVKNYIPSIGLRMLTVFLGLGYHVIIMHPHEVWLLRIDISFIRISTLSKSILRLDNSLIFYGCARRYIFMGLLDLSRQH